MRFADFALEPSGGYVKDWHFKQTFPLDAARLVPTPRLFRDDWLNGYANAARCSDYEFVYVGGAGTTTHLHTDVVSNP
jgi:hypothetical protein